MKRIFYLFFLCFLFLFFFLTLTCMPEASPETTTTVDTSLKMRLGYYRLDGNYNGWSAHLWNNSGWAPTNWGPQASFSSKGTTDGSTPISYNVGNETIDGLTFRYIEFKIPTLVQTGGANFIIHSGDIKEHNGLDMIWPSPTTFNKIYYKSGDGTKIYTVYNGHLVLVNYIISASLVSDTQISITLAENFDNTNDSIKLFEDNIDISNSVTIISNLKEVTLSGTFDGVKSYEISFNGQSKVKVQVLGSYYDNNPDFIPDETADLGVAYSGGDATFKVWAPLASSVKVNFYSTWDQAADSPTSSYNMSKGGKGIWSVTVNGVTEGQLYQYELKYGNTTYRALDPYAKSMGCFKDGMTQDTIGKGAVVDPSLHNPTGWGSVGYYNLAKREDAIIYEVHVRDFTIDPDIEGDLGGEVPGTYKAFIKKLNHLQDLGVTHVQLLPVMSYYYGDETKNTQRELTYSKNGNNYNWGYDPHSYFAPEGMYSADPQNPIQRIVELKELIKAIKDAGMGVILDCVYNHTANTSVLGNLVPGYYYRPGRNSSGCGNDTATENKMMRKLIVDSLKYWVSEYKVDGFRFDLMGLIDAPTVEKGYTECSTINPKVLFIGEGWLMNLDLNTITWCNQNYMNQTDNIACFADGFRDFFKKGGYNEGQPGFLTGTTKYILDGINVLKGQPGAPHLADDPGDCVNYLTCHDGLTWFDTIKVATMDTSDDRVFKRMKLGHIVTLTSQGIAFLHAGSEMGRTKEFVGWTSADGLSEVVRVNIGGTYKVYVRNSYDSSDAINMINWNEWMAPGSRGEALYNYTKGLIALRKSTDAFRLGLLPLVNSKVTLQYPPSTSYARHIAYKCVDSTNDSYFVFINAETTSKEFNANEDMSTATCIVDDDEAGTNEVSNRTGFDLSTDPNYVIVQPLTGVILKK